MFSARGHVCGNHPGVNTTGTEDVGELYSTLFLPGRCHIPVGQGTTRADGAAKNHYGSTCGRSSICPHHLPTMSKHGTQCYGLSAVRQQRWTGQYSRRRTITCSYFSRREHLVKECYTKRRELSQSQNRQQEPTNQRVR